MLKRNPGLKGKKEFHWPLESTFSNRTFILLTCRTRPVPAKNPLAVEAPPQLAGG